MRIKVHYKQNVKYKKRSSRTSITFSSGQSNLSTRMLKTLKSTKNLEIKEAMVENLLVEDKKIKGIELEDGTKINADAVILTTGTYLKAVVLAGSEKKSSGPHGEKESKFLSDNLRKLGFTIKRLKNRYTSTN